MDDYLIARNKHVTLSGRGNTDLSIVAHIIWLSALSWITASKQLEKDVCTVIFVLGALGSPLRGAWKAFPWPRGQLQCCKCALWCSHLIWFDLSLSPPLRLSWSPRKATLLKPTGSLLLMATSLACTEYPAPKVHQVGTLDDQQGLP